MQINRPISLTVGFPRTRAMEVLGASATANGFQFVGLPNVWKAERLKKIDKFTLIKHFLASGNVSPDAVILFTDAYDVLIADRATRVVQLFARTGCDLIFNAETTFFPSFGRNPQVKNLFDTFSSPWRYLNSGCFIGYAWAVEQLVDYGLAITATDPTADDQALSQDFFFLHHSGSKIKVGLDVDLSIFASINATAHEFSISSNGIYHSSSGTSPISIIHANGDKSNIAALERYFHTWVDNTSERPLTLKVLRTDRGYANLDSEAQKLIFGEEFGWNSVLFALVGNRRGCAFVGGQQGCMTFDGSANVYINRDDIHNWEVVDVRGTPKSFHGLELSRYFLEQPGFARLSDVTLSELKPEFAKLFCEHLKNYSRQLMNKPWIGPRCSSEE